MNSLANRSNPLRANTSAGTGRVSRCSETVSGADGSAQVRGAAGAAVAVSAGTSAPSSPSSTTIGRRDNGFTRISLAR